MSSYRFSYADNPRIFYDSPFEAIESMSSWGENDKYKQLRIEKPNATCKEIAKYMKTTEESPPVKQMTSLLKEWNIPDEYRNNAKDIEILFCIEWNTLRQPMILEYKHVDWCKLKEVGTVIRDNIIKYMTK